ncbi:MAG: hypothetical protein DHS20C01_15180 [marine bacterium B5-7]|nr:MAG: hypothetical protein DHS20C01_15180 [marine bacterium B5-7]
MINDESIPKPVEGYRVEEMDGELLLYHPQSTATVYMNNTAALVWQLCDGSRETAEIVSILSESFPDASTSVRQDVIRALETFTEQGALEVSGV